VRGTLISADLAQPDPNATGEVAADWLRAVPADRPTMIVCDGLVIPLPGFAFRALTRALTLHFTSGEYAFSAYHPIALRNPMVAAAAGLNGPPAAGKGFVDPREPERWNARLSLQEELLIARSRSVAKFPQPWKAFARLTSRATGFHRTGDRVVRYRF
jgi:O-methyltransferase involved in polyketide biosynthesis